MQHKTITVFLSALLVSACMDLGPAYDPSSLNLLTVQAVYPDDAASRDGALLQIDEVSSGPHYVVEADADGLVETHVPNGVYRLTFRASDGDMVYNATRDRVVVSGEDVRLSMEMKRSRTGSILIKEIYNGGCLKLPQEGNYQSDQYVLLHNNSAATYYLDGLCMGTLSPYNSYGSNPWLGADGTLPDFLPIIQAVLMMPGDGDDFPLEPGEDALVCLRGAIDHPREYPLSVNLNRADAFVLYDEVLFPNPVYHPAPGDQVDPDRYLKIVIKTGQANAYTLSVTSPAFVIFRAAEGTDIYQYVNEVTHQPQVPGGGERVVAIPPEWVMDGVEVFYGGSTGNHKRLPETVDAGAVTLSENFKGHTLMRRRNEEASASLGYEVLQDTNSSTEDFYERETQSLHE